MIEMTSAARERLDNYLQRLRTLPRCRFDTLAIDGEAVEWLKAAFDAG